MRVLPEVFVTMVLTAAPLAAQPSGGPYGPIQQTYDVPAAPHVYYVAPGGRSDAPGTLAQPTTLESAIAQVVTGDAVVLRGGVYRTGGLLLNQGITLQPYRDERPVLKGTQLATTWQPLRNKLWKTSWTTLFPAKPLGWWQRDREGMRTPVHRFNNDMVFVDGRLLQSAGWEGEVDENSYYIDYDKGQVYIGVDPAGRQVEITAFDSALVRTSLAVHGKVSDRKGPTIRGITFTQYAYRALEVEGKKQFTSADEPTDEPVGLADPSTFGKEVVGTVLENVTITFCSRVAGYFRGDGLVIRNSLISDTSTEGIYVIGSSDVLLERNIIRRNNVEHLTGYYPAAVKIFNQTRRVTCRDNLVIDNPDSNGIWYDVGNRDAVFVNNWIENAQDGFFFEISRGAIVAGNVFVRCNKGVRVLNSADVRVYNNTFVDTAASFERNERSATGDHFGWHPSTGPGVDAARGARLRRQPARGQRRLYSAPAALRAAEGPVREAHTRTGGNRGRECLRAGVEDGGGERREARSAGHVESGRHRHVPDISGLTRRVPRAGAHVRGPRPVARPVAAVRLQESGARSLRAWAPAAWPDTRPGARRRPEAARLERSRRQDGRCLPTASVKGTFKTSACPP